jgi:copper(I)-binding protein
MKKAVLLITLTLLSLSQMTFSQSVEKPWVKRPIPGMKLTGAYMTIKNPSSKDIYLIDVKGEDAEFYEIHTHEKINGVMKMRQIKKLRIPAKGSVTLKPKSFHIMLIQLKKGRLSPKATKTNLTLIFDNKEKVTIEASILKASL